MKHTVTIQGVAGCYHDAAARQYFQSHFPDDEIETLPCDTFRLMFDRLDIDPSLIGIMAIENTIAGALLQNHELLRRSNLSPLWANIRCASRTCSPHFQAKA